MGLHHGCHQMGKPSPPRNIGDYLQARLAAIGLAPRAQAAWILLSCIECNVTLAMERDTTSRLLILPLLLCQKDQDRF